MEYCTINSRLSTYSPMFELRLILIMSSSGYLLVKNDEVCALLHNSADSTLCNFDEDSCGSRIWLLEQGLRQPCDGI